MVARSLDGWSAVSRRSFRTRLRLFAVAGAAALAATAAVSVPGTASARECPAGDSLSLEGQCVCPSGGLESSEGQCAGTDVQPASDTQAPTEAPQPTCEPVMATGPGGGTVPANETLCSGSGDFSEDTSEPVQMGAGFGESACPGGCEG